MNAAEYILDTFHKDDNLVAASKRGGDFTYCDTRAEEIAGERIQDWMCRENATGGNICIGMNPLPPEATSRRKSNVRCVRHVFLDIDRDGIQALMLMQSDGNLPEPSYVLNTSPGKYQVIWKAWGFTRKYAEQLQRALAIYYGATRASTAASSLLRLPGFLNHKYDPPSRVNAEKISSRICYPADFHVDWNVPLPRVTRPAVPQPYSDEPAVERKRP